MSFRDILDNVKFAYYGLAFEVKDPFNKKKLFDEFEKYGVTYADGYLDDYYSYAVTHINKSAKKNGGKLINWFKENFPDWRFYYTKHPIFRTTILVMCEN